MRAAAVHVLDDDNQLAAMRRIGSAVPGQVALLSCIRLVIFVEFSVLIIL